MVQNSGKPNATKFRSFQPLHGEATLKIEQLVSRGGVIVHENKSYVEITREKNICRIDQWGRVEWRNEIR